MVDSALYLSRLLKTTKR